MDSIATQSGTGQLPDIIPIACRFVPTDQWLTTHIDTSWKINQVKLFLLAKFFPSSFISVPFLPRMQASSKKRAVSPIRFASKPLLSPTSADARASDGEDGYEEDEEEYGDELFGQYKWSASTRRSTSALPMIAKPKDTELASEDDHAGSSTGYSDPSQYTLLTWSSGQVLEDHFTMAWFQINAHELLELHSTQYMVTLPKSLLEDYIEPYFEAPVWALRTISRVYDGEFDGSGKKGDSAEYGPYVGDGRPGEPGTTSRKDKLAKTRRTKLEWRPIWVIIHRGVFKLYKTRGDTRATHVAPLSSLIALHGANKLPVVSPPIYSYASATTLDQANFPKSQSRGKGKDTECIISAQFRAARPKTSRILQPRSSMADVTAGMGQSAAGWFRRGSKDTSSNHGHERRRGSAPESNAAVDEKEEFAEKERDRESRSRGNDYDWIVLDMRNTHAFDHILRLLHRHAAPTLESSFFPGGPSLTQTNAPSSNRQTSLDSERPPSPISFASRPPSTLPPSSPSSSVSNFSTLDSASTLSHSWTPPPVELAPETTTRSTYPEWRRRIVERARRVGMGDVGTAMTQHIFGEARKQRDDRFEVETLGGKRSRKTSTVEDQGVIGDTGLERSSPQPIPLHRTGVLEDDDEDCESCSSAYGSDPESDLEWEGWAQDVKQRRDIAFATIREEREKNSINWDSKWAFGSRSHSGDLQQPQGQPISPGADQTSFSSLGPGGASASKGGGRSVTSYASEDSLLKRTIKRAGSKEPSAVASSSRSPECHSRHGPSHDHDRSDSTLDHGKLGLGLRSPLSTEFDDVEEVDEPGHEPKYTYASSHIPQFASDDQSMANIPVHSYYDSAGIPMPLKTTTTSVVSVAYPDDSYKKGKKKDKKKKKSSSSRKSAYSSALSTVDSGSTITSRQDQLESFTDSTPSTKGKQYSRSEGSRDPGSTSNTRALSPTRPTRPTKPPLTIPASASGSALATGRSISGGQLHSAVSSSSTMTHWESPRFAKPEEDE